MKTKAILYTKIKSLISLVLWTWIFLGMGLFFSFGQNGDFIEYKGQVLDANSGAPIPEAHLSVEQTNISGLANSNGVFSLKIPKELDQFVVNFFKINYQPKAVQLTFFEDDFTEIVLEPTDLETENLPEIEIYRGEDPRLIVEKALKKRAPNQGKLVGFYREKIDRGRRNVLLGEAVVQVDQDKYMRGKKGEISIYKSRKRTDYERLDTLAVKLQGGPYSGLHLDLAAYPQFVFYEKKLDAFDFKFEEPTTIDGRYVYVVAFEQWDKSQPWYFGKMFIDAKNNALIKADYNLNVDDRRAATRMLVVNKPRRTKVTPLAVNYQAEYVEKDGQWYYNYGQFFIKLKVNWKGKLFNARYNVHTELAVFDRSSEAFFPKDELICIKPTVVLTDDITGFEDPEFWGANNVIHPDNDLQEIIEAIEINHQ